MMDNDICGDTLADGMEKMHTMTDRMQQDISAMLQLLGSLSEVPEQEEKAVSENTIVFNNLLNTLGELKEFWEVPASESWHNRFF